MGRSKRRSKKSKNEPPPDYQNLVGNGCVRLESKYLNEKEIGLVQKLKDISFVHVFLEKNGDGPKYIHTIPDPRYNRNEEIYNQKNY
jgi:hypothetical protein